MSLVAEFVARLRERDWSVATAESLTGGLVCAALTSVPGASSVVRGGVVAYAVDVKAAVLGVDRTLLAERGAVDGEVAAQMAAGVREALGASVGLSCTGVAGPEPADGRPVGTVFIAVVTPTSQIVRELRLAGSREEIRTETVERLIRLAETACAA